MDNRHLCVGCTAFFPVAVPGALFSCGDGHAAQGDGEVAGSAIETGMFCRMRLTVLKPVRWPSDASHTPFVCLGRWRGPEPFSSLGSEASMLLRCCCLGRATTATGAA